ncbi:MAG: 6-bladed beta-propeller [Planctomycetota bacterium]
MVKYRTMNHGFNHNITAIGSAALAMILCVALGGCSRPAGTIFTPLTEPLLWPQPPETPRIAYVGMISTEDDLKPAVSWSQGLKELFFGKEEIGVLISPTAVIGDSEKIYVTDSAGSVHIFDLESRQYTQVTLVGTEETLIMPVAATFMNQNICITDSVLKKVFVFDKRGNYEFSLGRDILQRPTGVVFNSLFNKLYVADTAKHNVKVFDSAGNQVSEFGSRGVEPGQFNFPTHLCTDEEGNVYVSDTLNYRVQVFSHKGTFLRTFGIHGDRPGNFAHPAGIATDSRGHVYVVDKQYENIQIFDAEGNILMAIGVEGHGPGQFWLPAGIFIGTDDRVYVADTFNKRIQVFEFLKTQNDDK